MHRRLSPLNPDADGKWERTQEIPPSEEERDFLRVRKMERERMKKKF